MQVVKPLADDVAENARPKTDEFIEKVLRPAIEDFKRMLEHSAEELAEKVIPILYILSQGNECIS